MECHARCAACCIVISIASPIPGMPDGKPAGVPCVNLDEERRCRLFGLPERPRVCLDLAFDPGLCGDGPDMAHARWGALEAVTAPAAGPDGAPPDLGLGPIRRQVLPLRGAPAPHPGSPPCRPA